MKIDGRKAGCGFLVWLIAACGSVVYTVPVADAPMMGDKGAPHQLAVYSDFECPFCKRTAAALKEFAMTHPKRAAIYFKHYPLRQHPHSMRAARAAEAAHLQGKFWEMHDLIFAHQGGLNDGIFIQLAEQLGLDVAKFEADMKSETASARVASDMSEAEAIGLWGTPFFVLDGAPFNGRLSELLSRLQR